MVRVTLVVMLAAFTAAVSFVAMVDGQQPRARPTPRPLPVRRLKRLDTETCAAEVQKLADQIKADPSTAIGTVFGAGVGALVPSDANRAACESYNFIDEDKRTGETEQHGIWRFMKMLADTFIPTKAHRVACIHLGYFHPKEEPTPTPKP